MLDRTLTSYNLPLSFLRKLVTKLNAFSVVGLTIFAAATAAGETAAVAAAKIEKRWRAQRLYGRSI